MSFTDKVAVVTGGARGIGKEIASLLAHKGAKVALVDMQEDVVRATAEELTAAGFEAKAYAGNVVKYEEVEAFVKAIIEDFGRIDILVNNAGITRDGLVMRMKDADWDDVIAVNLKGTFNCSKAVFRPMAKNRAGKIVNIASVVGVMGNAGQANYAASKAGVIGLTKSTAKEFAARNINVNAVAPGYIQTDMTGGLTDDQKDRFLANTPLARAGTPQDVARVVCFLASEDADFVTGQTINIDGGLVM